MKILRKKHLFFRETHFNCGIIFAGKYINGIYMVYNKIFAYICFEYKLLNLINMKKLLILFLLAGVAFSTTSCKKKQKCPEPEVWGVGEWQATKFVYNGTEQDPSDPQVACLLSHKITLTDTWGGNWDYHYVDVNNVCQTLQLPLDSWVENLDKKVLILNFTYSGEEFSFSFDYIDDSHFHWTAGSNTYLEFTKQ